MRSKCPHWFLTPAVALLAAILFSCERKEPPESREKISAIVDSAAASQSHAVSMQRILNAQTAATVLPASEGMKKLAEESWDAAHERYLVVGIGVLNKNFPASAATAAAERAALLNGIHQALSVAAFRTGNAGSDIAPQGAASKWQILQRRTRNDTTYLLLSIPEKNIHVGPSAGK
jgi:hypothetical protein